MTGVVSASDKKTLPWWKSFLLISKKHFPGGSLFCSQQKHVRGGSVFVHNKKHVRGGNVLLRNVKKTSVVEVFFNDSWKRNTLIRLSPSLIPPPILLPSRLSPSLIPPPILLLTLRSQHFFLLGRSTFRDAPNVAAVPGGRRTLNWRSLSRDCSLN